jgi:hypothetical protein
VRRVALPERTLDEVLEVYSHLRQSLLANYDNCALMTRFSLEAVGYNNAAQARGIVWHLFARRFLETLARTGEAGMSVSEALEILYEASAQREVPDDEVVVLSARERRLLRIAVMKFATENQRFDMRRLMGAERRLYTTVEYPRPGGGTVTRSVTGQPDALLSDPPDGAVVLDWKMWLSPPPRYKGKLTRDHAAGVSYMGYFQQRIYGLLVMRRYPSVQRVTLREFYPLAGESRTATVYPEDLEHVERELANLCELLDRSIAGGSGSAMWRPSPGLHCNYCPRPASCPIAPEERAVEGGITTAAEAARSAADYVVASRVRKALGEALKDWVRQHGPVPVKDSRGRHEVRFKTQSDGSRVFGVHVPERSDRGPEDPQLAQAFAEAAARRRSAA